MMVQSLSVADSELGGKVQRTVLPVIQSGTERGMRATLRYPFKVELALSPQKHNDTTKGYISSQVGHTKAVATYFRASHVLQSFSSVTVQLLHTAKHSRLAPSLSRKGDNLKLQR